MTITAFPTPPEPPRPVFTQHVTDEYARFDAWVTNFKAGPHGSWKLEVATADIYRDEAFKCTEQMGYVYEVVVYRKRFLTDPPHDLINSHHVPNWGVDLHAPETDDGG